MQNKIDCQKAAANHGVDSTKLWKYYEHSSFTKADNTIQYNRATKGYNKATNTLNKKAVLSQRWPQDACYISGSNEPLWRYGHSKLSKMAACRQLGLDITGNSAIQSADPENPTLEPNMKWIGSPVAEIWPFAYVGAYETPILGEREVVWGQRWHH